MILLGKRGTAKSRILEISRTIRSVVALFYGTIRVVKIGHRMPVFAHVVTGSLRHQTGVRRFEQIEQRCSQIRERRESRPPSEAASNGKKEDVTVRDRPRQTAAIGPPMQAEKAAVRGMGVKKSKELFFRTESLA